VKNCGTILISRPIKRHRVIIIKIVPPFFTLLAASNGPAQAERGVR
jgi:hypothetical protein